MKTTTKDMLGLPIARPPTHPGEMLLEEFLVPAGLSQVMLATKMKVPTNRVNELVRGKRGITADTALRLSDIFGTRPQFWLALQANWDLWHALRTRRRAA